MSAVRFNADFQKAFGLCVLGRAQCHLRAGLRQQRRRLLRLRVQRRKAPALTQFITLATSVALRSATAQSGA